MRQIQFRKGFKVKSLVQLGCFAISLIRIKGVFLNRVKTLISTCLCAKNIFKGLVNCCSELSKTPAIQNWVDRRV